MKQLFITSVIIASSFWGWAQKNYYEGTLVSVECGDYCTLTLSSSDEGFFVDDFEILNTQFPSLFTPNEYGDYEVSSKYQTTTFYVLTDTRSFKDDNGTVRQEYVVRIFKK